VYVAQPDGGFVQQFSPEGTPLNKLAAAGASAVAIRNIGGDEQLIVGQARIRNNKWLPFHHVLLFDTRTLQGQPLTLSKPVMNCQEIAVDQTGNLYLLGGVHQIYKFDANGKLLSILGAGTTLRRGDGSEPVSAAVDSKGDIYTTNLLSNQVSRFNPEMTTVWLRNGGFRWADDWSGYFNYLPIFKLDHEDRLWVMVIGETQENAKYHYRPCVARLVSDYFNDKNPQVAHASTRSMGLDLEVRTTLPWHVGNALASTPVELIVQAANRELHLMDVDWEVYDLWKNAVAGGRFSMQLEDGRESVQSISFTPPRYGWYDVVFRTSSQGFDLESVGEHIGFTPEYSGMPVLTADLKRDARVDPVVQAFSGLPLMRVNSRQLGDDQNIDRVLNEVAENHLTLLVQFENRNDAQPDMVRKTVTKLGTRVQYYEVINEPNLSMSPDDYVRILKEAYKVIKSINPSAMVMGPAVCGINLGWCDAFYRSGGKNYTDIISVHDYEGNESIDPGHWIWKFGELRKLMARHGDGDKPIWQTERAIGGVRAGNFIPGVQAVRILLQRDLLETLRIPAEHNLHYYLNASGYSQVPTYVWSPSGPHPAALATRTRQAMIAGRTFEHTLDFGVSGDQIFMGLLYTGEDGSTITLRNYGTLDQNLELAATGNSVEAVDAFGNSQIIPVIGGHVTLTISDLPTYLRLSKGQTVTPPNIDFGRNIAPMASFSFSAPVKGDNSLLTNGIFESHHEGDKNPAVWTGDLNKSPQVLEITFAQEQTINRVLLFSERADNPYCALLDYDLEYQAGSDWVTLQRVRTPCPPSNPAITTDCKVDTWYLDQNFFVNEFAPVQTRELRLVVYRTTHGFQVDDTAVQATGWSANTPHLMLREVEIYGPSPLAR
jgi:hypothetical protein